MNLKKKVIDQIKQIRKNAVEIVSEEELFGKIEHSLRTFTPLRIKAGFDPTAGDIHLGHAVLLKKLREFQELGHIVYFIVGDFTARIGDPSGRDETRPALSQKQIIANARTYTEQAFKILDKKKTKIVFNSKWFDKMNVGDLTSLLKNYTVARLLERDDFSQRIKQNRPITMLEFFYPLMQGYDSIKVKADIELGGTDQKFNLLVGRRLQERFGQNPQVIMTLPLLVGLDGKNKMSKSLGNYIGIKEEPSEIFGKTMSIPDELMYNYYEVLTDLNLLEIKQKHPKEAKEMLAATFVSWFHGEEEAKRERERFRTIFSRKDLSSQSFQEYVLPRGGKGITQIMVEANLSSSNNEARRLLRQNAVEFNNKKILDEKAIIVTEGILKVGKKKFVKIITR